MGRETINSWPICSPAAFTMWFAAARFSHGIPKRSAIPAKVSPACTTYLEEAVVGAVGLLFATLAGDGVAARVALAVVVAVAGETAVSERRPAGAVGVEDGVMPAVGVFAGVLVGLGVGTGSRSLCPTWSTAAPVRPLLSASRSQEMPNRLAMPSNVSPARTT